MQMEHKLTVKVAWC